MENKHQKFSRLAESRTNSILNSIRLLSNLANKKNYCYTSEEINKIFKAIDKELRKCKLTFKDKEVREFKL